MQPIDRIEQLENIILALINAAFGFKHPDAANTPPHVQLRDAMKAGVIPEGRPDRPETVTVAEPIRPEPPAPPANPAEPFAPEKPGDV